MAHRFLPSSCGWFANDFSLCGLILRNASSVYSLTQQIFIEHLLGVRHWGRTERRDTRVGETPFRNPDSEWTTHPYTTLKKNKKQKPET